MTSLESLTLVPDCIVVKVWTTLLRGYMALWSRRLTLGRENRTQRYVCEYKGLHTYTHACTSGSIHTSTHTHTHTHTHPHTHTHTHTLMYHAYVHTLWNVGIKSTGYFLTEPKIDLDRAVIVSWTSCHLLQVSTALSLDTVFLTLFRDSCWKSKLLTCFTMASSPPP